MIALVWVTFGQVLNAQSTSETKFVEVEVGKGMEILESATNDFLDGKTTEESLDRFVLNESDLEYWMGQFEFTPEVLEHMSREEFYNKLSGWAVDARYNYLTSIKGMDKVKLVDYKVKFDETPGLRVNRSANAILYLYKENQPVGELRITMIECRGLLKFIQAE